MIQYYITDKGEALLEDAFHKAEHGEGSVSPPIFVLLMFKQGWTTEQVFANAVQGLGEKGAREEVPRILKAMERNGLIAKDVPLDDASLEGNGTDLPDIFKRNFPQNI